MRMIGLFKKKEQNNKINLSNYFNWIKSLDKQKLELSNQDLDERLIYSKTINKIKGIQLDFEQADNECYQQAIKELNKTIIPNFVNSFVKD